MAALPAGVKYGLSSESSYKENKELMFVKLTDSALKAIEDYIRNNNRDKLAKPKIQFLPGNEGKFSIPAPPGTSSSGESTFHFSINSNAEIEGPQGSFECVRNGGPRRLEACGPLPRRMRVQAKDDSYEATKDRMAKTIAAEQSKGALVIKPNQTDIGRRVKVRSSHFSSGSSERVNRERLDRADRERERVERVERPTPPAPRPHQNSSQNTHNALNVHNASQNAHNALQNVNAASNASLNAHNALQNTHSANVPAHQTHQPHHQTQPQRPPPNPGLTRRSIKERLIQLLALKPFKKPELYARLNMEGIKEKERPLVNKILPSIGALKDNCYHLLRHIWNDVNEDWPFYTEEEKRMLKRRKPQNLTPPLSSDSANSLSPRASPGGSGSKRPSAAADELPAKKQRISHYRRVSPPSSGYATTSSGERHASDNEDDRTSVKKDNGYTLNFTTVKDLCPSPVKANGYRNSPPVEQKANGYRNSPPVEQKANGYRNSPPVEQTKANGYRNSPPVEPSKANGYRNSPPVEQTKANVYRSSPPMEQSKANGYRSSPPIEQTSITEKDITHTEPLDNTELSSVPMDDNMTDEMDLEEIQRQYPPITSSSVRRAYKNEFATLYTEYRRLYAEVASVAELFTRLEAQLRRAPKHSPDHQRIEQCIVEEYRRRRNDTSYQRNRRRVNFLHTKLNHIKRMVHEYDQLRHMKPERVNTATTTQAY